MSRKNFTPIKDPARLSYQHISAIRSSDNKDSDIVPSNIKEGVEILGVVGTMKVPTGKQTITDTTEVNVTNYATAQVVDANLIAENIKKDVTILGVTGTYEA